MNPQHVRRSLERWHWGIYAAALLCLFISVVRTGARLRQLFQRLVHDWRTGHEQLVLRLLQSITDSNTSYEPGDIIPFFNDGTNVDQCVGNNWNGDGLGSQSSCFGAVDGNVPAVRTPQRDEQCSGGGTLGHPAVGIDSARREPRSALNGRSERRTPTAATARAASCTSTAFKWIPPA